MRELDFLPPWYRELLRRRRATLLHLGALGLLVIGVSVGEVSRRFQLRASDQQLTAAEGELAGIHGELQKLDALLHLRDQWRRQEQALTSTGVNVEASRLVSSLAQVVPVDTALTSLTFSVAEPERVGDAPLSPTTAPVSFDATAKPAPHARRRLNVTLRGVAPGEVAVASVLAGISKTPLFKHVNLSYAKDKEDRERLVREFEVTFVIELDSAGAVATPGDDDRG